MSHSENRLSFVKETHQYFLDGLEIPSVNAILQAQGIKQGDFSMVDEDILARSIDYGNAVHATCKLDNQGSLKKCPEGVEADLEGWRKFKKDFAYCPEISEHPICSKVWKFAGTPDSYGMGHYKMGLITFIPDIKTSTMDDPGNAIQIAAYEIALRELKLIYGRVIRMTVRLTMDGKYKLTPHRDKTDLNTFLSALSTYQWRKKNGKLS